MFSSSRPTATFIKGFFIFKRVFIFQEVFFCFIKVIVLFFLPFKPGVQQDGRRAQAELVELSVGRCAQAPSIDDRGVMRTALDKGLEPFKEHGNASFGSLHNVSKV